MDRTTAATDDDHDSALSNSSHITRSELMRRRASRLSRLARCYRDHYWSLMEDVRIKHREFKWKYGKDNRNHNHNHNNNHNHNDDVFEEQLGILPYNDNPYGIGIGIGIGIGGGGGGEGEKLGFDVCKFPNCQSKAMALTDYCNSHILSDASQLLYIGCKFPHRCGDNPILCGKPILRSAIPSLCHNHIKPAEYKIRKGLNNSGASYHASVKLAPKFHLVLTEYVRLIQARRRVKRVNNVARGGTAKGP